MRDQIFLSLAPRCITKYSLILRTFSLALKSIKSQYACSVVSIEASNVYVPIHGVIDKSIKKVSP